MTQVSTTTLKTYQRVLVDEFIREWHFLIDVIQGRATRRADFTDKMLGFVNSALPTALSNAPFPGASILSSALSISINWGNLKRKERHNDTVEAQAYAFDDEEIRYLLEAVAFEACRRYQWIILERLQEGSVITLAKTGVERMLEYLVRTGHPLQFETLLEGLIAGHSGAFVMGYTNAQLKLKGQQSFWKQVKEKLKLGNFTAEGVYGRSAFTTEDGTLYAMFDAAKARHKRVVETRLTEAPQQSQSSIDVNAFYNYGYAKAKDGTRDPKYGYSHVSPVVVKEWYGHLQPAEYRQELSALSPEMKEEVKSFQSRIVAIDRPLLKAYLAQKKTIPSLIQFVRETKPDWGSVEVIVYDPSEAAKGRDLRDLDLTHADFSGCVFQGCIWPESLSNIQLQQADCRYGDFSAVKNATKANFSEAQMIAVNLKDATFRGANLTGVNFSYAKADGANFEETIVLGALWYKASLSEIKTGHDLSQVSREQEELSTKQAEATEELEKSLEAQQRVLHNLQEQLKDLPTNTELRAMVQDIYQEKQERLILERSTKQALRRLKIRQSLTEAKLIQHDNEIEALTQQVKKLQEQSQALDAIVADVQKLNASSQNLEKTMIQLEERFSHLFLDQEQRITQLTSDVRSVQQQVRHAVITPEVGQRLALQAKMGLQSQYLGFNEIRGLFGKSMQLEGQYINLQMLYHLELKEEDLKDEEARKAREELQAKQAPEKRLSSFEDLFGDKRSIVPADLFKPDKALFPEKLLKNQKNAGAIPNFLLIQGRAGIGKTTFVHYVSREWAKGKLFTEFQWVFTLTLRELRNPEFKALTNVSLWEWIYRSQFSNMIDADFSLVWQQKIQPALREGKVLIVLDGFDEIPEKHPCQKTLNSLLAGEYACTPKIITSRPYGLSQLPVERRNLEIIGFTDANIEQYIGQYFTDQPTYPSKLISVLKNNPVLWGTCHIPITANLICGILEGNASPEQVVEALQTMTGIYISMEQKLLERAYLAQDSAQHLSEIPKRRITALLSHYERERKFLAELAFLGLQQEEIILSRQRIDELLEKHDIQDDAAFMQRLRQLGLIKPVIKCKHVSENQQSYEFIHLTFQEYYAAIHVSSQQNNPAIQTMVLAQKLNTRWKIVWWFTAGLLKDDKKFSAYIDLLEGRNSHGALVQDIAGHYELGILVRCLEEGSPGNEIIRLRIQTRLQQTLATLFEAYTNYRLPEDFSPSFITALQLSPSWLHQEGSADLLALLPNMNENEREVLEFSSRWKLATPELLKRILLGLKNKDLVIRPAAARAIGSLGSVAVTPEILSELLVLLRDKYSSIHCFAIDATGSLGSAAATPLFLSGLLVLLQDKDKKVRSAAAEAIGKLGSAAATPLFLSGLLVLLQGEDKNVREIVASAIGKLGSAAATPLFLSGLLVLLQDEDKNVRETAASAIGKLGSAAATPEILSELLVLLRDEDKDVRETAAYLISKLGSAAATPEILSELLVLLRDEDKDVRFAVARAIGSLGSAAATPKILSGLLVLLRRDKYSSSHCAAIDATDSLGSAAVTPLFLSGLLVLLQDEDKNVRETAASVIGKLGSAAATPEILSGLLLVLLRDEDKDVRFAVARAIGSLGSAAATPEILSELSVLLEDKDKDVRETAAYVISKLGSAAVTPEILSRLLVLLGDEDKKVREIAASAIGELGSAAATPEILSGLLLVLLRDEDKDVRFAVVRTIRKLGSAAATPEFLSGLLVLLEDKDKDIRETAAYVISKLGSAAVTPEILSELLVLLRDEDKDVRFAVAITIGSLGSAAVTPEILSRLLVLLQDEDKKVRKAATEALKSLDSAKHQILKSIMIQWKTFSEAEKLRHFTSAVWLEYLNGTTRYQVRWLSQEPGLQAQSQYYLEGYFDKTSFQWTLTLEQAQWYRHLPPIIVKCYLETGDINPIKMLQREIVSWPPIEQDPLMSDYPVQKPLRTLPDNLPAVATLVFSQTALETRLTAKFPEQGITPKPVIFSANAASITTPPADVWESIFAPLKDTETYQFCSKVSVSIQQKDQSVTLSFNQSHELTEELLKKFVASIQEKNKNIFTDIEFPKVTFILDTEMQAKQFSKYLLEYSGLDAREIEELEVESP